MSDWLKRLSAVTDLDELYGERDVEAQGDYYVDHVRHMTGEDLHSKADIAAELAHRDIRYDERCARVKEQQTTIFELMSEIHRLETKLEEVEYE